LFSCLYETSFRCQDTNYKWNLQLADSSFYPFQILLARAQLVFLGEEKGTSQTKRRFARSNPMMGQWAPDQGNFFLLFDLESNVY
jgi:hypothetical protein